MACFMPPPISAGVILTQSIGGNEKLAIINSVIGNFLGIIVCPITLHTFLLNAIQVDGKNAISTFFNIVWMIVIPLFIGHYIYHFVKHTVQYKNYKDYLAVLNKIFLLCILYFTFYELFQNQHKITFGLYSVFILIVGIIIVQSIMVFLIYQFSLLFLGNTAKTHDMYAITYTASLKSLSTGVVILNAMLNVGLKDSTDSLDCSERILPLLLFEPIQILIGTLCQDLLRKMFHCFKANDEEIELNHA